MMVVVVDEWQEGVSALVRVGVGRGIGPFAQGCLDEPFRLAVGPGGVGFGEFLLYSKHYQCFVIAL